MKSLLSTCAAFALAGALFAPAALAQQTVVTPQQEQAGLPSGPYLLSCAHPRVVNGSLAALCDDQATAERGMDTWHMSQAPLAQAQQCNGALEDIDGRLTCGTAPMVGSSMPPQNYGSSFGTSGAPYDRYTTGAQGQIQTPPNPDYGSSYRAAGAPYDRYTTGAQGQIQTPPNPDYGSSYRAAGAPYDRYGTGAQGQPRTRPNPD
jgi:hypothetical protein